MKQDIKKPPLSNAERQKKYYHAHKNEKKLSRQLLGISTYTPAHKRYFQKKKEEKNGEL